MKSRLMLVVAGILFCLITAWAQQGPAAQKPATAGSTATINFTAKSANVSESGTPVKINIIRWSTDAESLPLLAALDPTLAPPPDAAAGRGGRGTRGAGGGRGGRGAQAADDAAPDPAAAAANDANAANAGGDDAAGRGGARGGRGGGRGRGGADAAPPKPADPFSNLTDAIGKAPTVGYIWTNEVVGYSIKYAHRIPFSDGGERIILATDRRLGEFNNGWKPAGTATPTNYGFTVVELRIDPKGAGEGKTSLTAKVVVDNEAKALVLENYTGTPVMLAGVKK